MERKNCSVKWCVVFGVPDDGQTTENQLYFVGLGLWSSYMELQQSFGVV